MLASTTPGQRFTQLIQYLGLSKNAFAQSLGKTATVIQHLVDERNKPGFDLLCKVFEVYPNVSKDWLMEGKGDMLKDGTAAISLTSATAAAPAPELDFDPIRAPDLPRPPRRQGSSLQPADIAATLALAAALPAQAAVVAVPPLIVQPASAPPAAIPPPAPEPAPTAAATAPLSFAPDANHLAIVFQTQQLQHQLALAEQRSQHLLEQQQLMQQLVAVLRER